MIANTEQDRGEFLRLIRRAKAEPFNDDVMQAFYKAYEKAEQHSDDETMAYLMLRCVREGFASKWLNGLAKIFLGRHDFCTVYKCLSDSLRLDPQQPDVFKQMQELEEYSRPETIGPQNNPSCKVSVIIATYNRPVEIREAIESVLAQTLKDYELIIVNDGGSGELETIVKSYGSDKIRYIALEKNIGHYAATNLAIEMSRGKYIAYLDDDDVYYPEHLEKLAEVLDNSPQKLVYSNTNAVEGKTVDGRFVEERKFYYWDQEYNRDKLAEKTFITNTTLMHRRNLLCDTGLFYEGIQSSDWEMWVRMALATDFVHLDAVTSEYRFRGDNVCRMYLHAVHFTGKLVSNYHKYHQGRVAFIKYYLATGDTANARLLYEEIKDGYESGFRTEGLFKELIAIAERLDDKKFLKKISKDYFERMPRKCLRVALEKKSLPMMTAIFPSVPLWAGSRVISKGIIRNSHGRK